MAVDRARADLADGQHALDTKGATIGLRARYHLGANTIVSGAAFAGQSRMELTSPDLYSGAGKTDGVHYGLTTRADYCVPADTLGGQYGYDLVGQAGFVASTFDGFTTSGLAGAGFDKRDVHTAFASIEAGLLVAMPQSTVLRPFVGAHVIRDTNSDVTLSLNGASTSFGVADTDRTFLSIGAEIAGTGPATSWTARAETRFDDNDTMQSVLSLSARF